MVNQLYASIRRSLNLLFARSFLDGEFVRNTLIIMTGTSVAQGITIAVAPILTRLYTPADFGVFALYLSIVTIFAVIATGRYDLAIMLPDSDEDAINLIALSILTTFITSCVIFVVVLLGRNSMAQLLGHPEIGPWLLLVPVAILLVGVYQIIYAWSNRQKRFRGLSIGRLSGAGVGSATNVGMGFSYAGIVGLITGYIVNQAVAIGVLIWQFGAEDRQWVSKVTLVEIGKQARRYYRFPAYSLPADFANTVAQQTPVLLLNAFFGASVVGTFSLTQRIVGFPMSLIGASVSTTFRQRASNDYITYGNCRSIYVKIFKSLFMLSILPFLLVIFFGPQFFEWVFGAEWLVAGKYARILAPLFLLRFVVSPLSYVLYVAEEQIYDLIGQSLLLLFSVLSIFIGGYLGKIEVSLVAYSISYSAIYIFYLIVSYHFACGSSASPACPR